MTWKEAREKEHISVKEISDKLNITRQAYYYKEKGKRRFNLEELRILLKEFKVDLFDIDF